MNVICITTYNEQDSIRSLIREFTRLKWTVIVSDGGSDDETVLKAFGAGAKILTSDERIGIGPAMLRAWQYALDLGADGVIQIDAGGSHRAADCLNFLPSKHHQADVIIGSRFIHGARYDNAQGTWLRPTMSRIAATMMNYAQTGARYTDWTSGYRYFSRRALNVLLNRDYIATMHGWQMEVLAYAGEAGLTIKEVPIRYTAGRSSFNRKVAWEAFLVWSHVLNHVGWVGSRLHEPQTKATTE